MVENEKIIEDEQIIETALEEMSEDALDELTNNKGDDE